MRLIFFFFAALLSSGLFGQSVDRFKNFHGLKAPGGSDQFLEAEGYDIFIQTVNHGLDEKGILKIRKRYSAKDAVLSTDAVLNIKTLTGTKEQNGIIAKYSFYLIPINPSATSVVGFIRPMTQDIGLERDFVTSFSSGKIPDFVYTNIEIDSIDFVGRSIQLGPICRWMGPHNIQCPDRGQMNWAIFDNLQQAEEYREARLEMAKSKTITDVQEENWIDLKFEGQITKALKTKIKIQVPKLVMGGSNLLVVYYVTGQVRGKYVTCVLSHYTDDVGADTLPPLLGEVLELVK
jgi:hypothetical protein